MKRLLVTGGLGKIGKYFAENFHSQYQIKIADIKTDASAFSSQKVDVVTANLLDYQSCLNLCQNADIIIHLAGIADPRASFEQVLDSNILGTKNIFQAAITSGCQRIIFASSAQTIESYSTDIQVKESRPVRPKNLYGVSKCFGEALAAYHAYNDGISIICLRIGAYEFPEDHQKMNARDLSAFLHPDDMNQLLVRCIEQKNIQFEILNAISDNRYKRLDITSAREKVGYKPQADAFKLFDTMDK